MTPSPSPPPFLLGPAPRPLTRLAPRKMPVLLVPASYEEGKTGTTTAAEAEGNDTQGVVVETTMGEVRLLRFSRVMTPLSSCLPVWVVGDALTPHPSPCRPPAAPPPVVRPRRPREAENGRGELVNGGEGSCWDVRNALFSFRLLGPAQRGDARALEGGRRRSRAIVLRPLVLVLCVGLPSRQAGD